MTNGFAKQTARLLIADDDGVSLQFLVDVCARLGCEAVAAGSGEEALRACHEQNFDLLLLDRRMPDLGGSELLQALRKQNVTTAAIVTSAQLDSTMIAALHSAGFAGHLEKPATLAQIELLLRKHLPNRFTGEPNIAAENTRGVSELGSILDDASALRAIGGSVESLRALRGLLVTELEALQHELRASDTGLTDVELRERLHKLRAACGFCGAERLAAAARSLEDCMTRIARDQAQTEIFLVACEATLHALRASSN